MTGLRFGLALAASVLALGVAQAQEPKKGGTVHVVVQPEPPMLMQGLNQNGPTNMVAGNIYESLLRYNEKLEPQPSLAKSWEISPDAKVYTFKLQEGVTWHDGKPFTAEDVVFTLDKFLREVHPRWRPIVNAQVDKIEKVDDLTVKITLKQPFGPMLEAIGTSSNPLFIMREQEAKIDPETAVTTMVGSGPFTFDVKDWNPGHSVTYRKFKDYRPRSEPASAIAGGKVVKVDAVEWIYLPDPNTRVQAVLRGEADTIEVIPPDLLPLLKASPNIEVRVMDKIGNQTMLRPNHLVPPFNNPKVRQALLYAVDQDQYLQVMQSDPSMRTLCWSVFMCGTPLESKAGVNNDWAAPGAKPAKAKALLAEAGYKNEPIVLMDPSDQPVISALTQISAQLMRQAGFNVDVQTMDWATLVSRRPVKEAPSVNKGGWHVFHTWGTGPFMSSPLMNSGAQTPCDGRNWFGWPCDDMLEKTRLEYLDADTPAKRMDMVERYQKRFYETVPYLPLGQFVGPIAYRKELKGVIQDIRLSFWNVEK